MTLADAHRTAAPRGPEHASGWSPKRLFQAREHVVASAHPAASAAGVAILEAGGHAVDAAIAVQAMLGLVEPQSSSLAGGGYALVYEAATGKVHAYDGREACPRQLPHAAFADAPGAAAPLAQLAGARWNVGVPGLPGLLGQLHARHGRLPWHGLLTPALDAAGRGFDVTHRVATNAAAEVPHMTQPQAVEYLTRRGAPVAAGTRLVNLAYASFLEKLAMHGAEWAYGPAYATEFCDTVRAGAAQQSLIVPGDFAAYRVRGAEVLRSAYRGRQVMTCGGSTAGGIMLLHLLGLVDQFAIKTSGPLDLLGVHLQLQASRLAFADRLHYLADPDFVPFDRRLLLGAGYLRQRASQISLREDMGMAAAGTVDMALMGRWGPSAAPDFGSTTHFSIVDRHGNAVAMTTSIGLAFGARLMSHGMFVNNQLVAFSSEPFAPSGKPVANRAEGGKRPLSSMAPAFVFGREGHLQAVTGSPGSSAIVGYVAKSILGHVDWGLDPQACCDLPNAINRNGVSELEAGTALAELAPTLQQMGHPVVLGDQTSGVHMVTRTAAGLAAGCDPRRDGQACGA